MTCGRYSTQLRTNDYIARQEIGRVILKGQVQRASKKVCRGMVLE